MFSIKILLAIILDLFLGDPSCYPHPVRCIGLAINRWEKFYRPRVAQPFWAGVLTVCSVLTLVILTLAVFFTLLAIFPPIVTDFAAVLLLYTTVAIKDLKKESMAVYRALIQGEDLPKTRKLLARIVGRDTENLDRPAIIRATVETVGENLADGIIAPLFWAVALSIFAPLLGVKAIVLASVGAMSYKAINTMDSMLGYKNERYILFGRAAARLDDWANWLPARCTALGIVAISFMAGYNGPQAWKIFKRDRYQHTSPNAGHPEAALAGALNIRLCGPSVYFGNIVEKPYIGNALRAIEPDDIRQANRIVLFTTFLLSLLFLLFRFVLTGL
ncbi:adenosylcobinamide-phosphate synthase CbiB [Desulfotalea psychrophila]|uniref:Cobalamin biosynthesis protein CobD n=1 Tax=Desulfotalea psychrophila (strain LSv54 / DSM 12343) TaxID=177439 RepID=COBD_DESPS|nr:adenosylcobinamide-phosphate synthase CbiB [Desulfotalea psychrophila]Q6ALU7.1 RecName: Full=Cobalamin biosynthesis protein CobD [Desulfotalea psychrophila LSv54]CAG36678.1 related to cobalamin biosynthesis protein (CobD) [Desulfotalea psychrophila LSv54]